MHRIGLFLAISSVLCATAVQAAETQSLSAQVGDIAFVSDDDSITLIPVPAGKSFTLTASTQGASQYPPPKTRIDRLSINCTLYTPGQPSSYGNADFAPDHCQVNFHKGTKPMGGDPDVAYTLDKSNVENRFEITSSTGKLIEGRFHFRLKDAAGNSLTISDGKFRAEDRQL